MIATYFKSFIDIKNSNQRCPICDKKLEYYSDPRIFMCHTTMDARHFFRTSSINGYHYWNRYAINSSDYSYDLIQEIFYIDTNLYGETITCFGDIDIRSTCGNFTRSRIKYDPETQSAVDVAKNFILL